MTPDKPKKADSEYMKKEKRKRFRSWASIEAVIGHLKSDFRKGQNYLHGEAGIQINALMSCAAWNLKKLMRYCVNKPQGLLRAFSQGQFLLVFGGFLPPNVIRKDQLSKE